MAWTFPGGFKQGKLRTAGRTGQVGTGLLLAQVRGGAEPQQHLGHSLNLNPGTSTKSQHNRRAGPLSMKDGRISAAVHGAAVASGGPPHSPPEARIVRFYLMT